MKKIVFLKELSLAKRLAFTALFAALCCVSTLLITVPLPASGFFNTGDVFVLLAGWCLGPLYGALAAAIGSALGDLLLSYAIYAPATFVIKGLDACAAFFVYAALKSCIRKNKLDTLPRVLSALVGEVVMVGGYFLFECVLYTVYGAIPNLVGNALQGACCIVCAALIVAALFNIKGTRKLFPPLCVASRNGEI